MMAYLEKEIIEFDYTRRNHGNLMENNAGNSWK
jgi:hypothetical protein